MGSAPSSPSPPKQTPTTPTAGGGRDGESPSNGGTYAFPPTIQSEVMGLSGGPRRPRALWTGLAVEAGVAGIVERGTDEAAVAEGAVDRIQQFLLVDAVGHAVEAEADVALAELRFAAELERRQAEVFDFCLDHDGVAGLPGTVARGDDLYAGMPRHRCRARLAVLGVGAAAENGGQRQGGGSRQHCQGWGPSTHRSGNITRNIENHIRRLPLAILALALGLALAAPVAAGADLAGHVNPFSGTRPGSGTFGGGHNFPGATLPFGMVQWGPDTSPSAPHSGGYDHRDNHIRGFSL